MTKVKALTQQGWYIRFLDTESLISLQSYNSTAFLPWSVTIRRFNFEFLLGICKL